MSLRLWMLRTQTAGGVRREELDGVEHIVLPVSALVEGVVTGLTSTGPELALASEFGEAVEQWNGRPVTLDHPSQNGRIVSANSPAMTEQFQVGTIFNAAIDDKTLTMEAWVNPTVLQERDPEMLERIETFERTGEGQIEVSTGLLSATEKRGGTYEGEEYEFIWRDVRSDHLALLASGSVGACSWEDGCGVRANSEPNTSIQALSACTCGGKCFGRLGDDYEAKLSAHTLREAAHNAGRFNSSGLSFEDTRAAVSQALASSIDLYAVYAMFDDTVVYETWESSSLFERGYTFSDGTVTLSEDTTEVRSETRYVPVSAPRANSRGREGHMDREKLLASLIANGTFGEDERESLLALSDEDFAAKLAESKPTVSLKDLSREQLDEAAEALGVKVHASDAELLSDENRTILEDLKAQRAQKREKDIAALKELNQFSDAEIEAFTGEQMESILDLAKKNKPAVYARPTVRARESPATTFRRPCARVSGAGQSEPRRTTRGIASQ